MNVPRSPRASWPEVLAVVVYAALVAVVVYAALVAAVLVKLLTS